MERYRSHRETKYLILDCINFCSDLMPSEGLSKQLDTVGLLAPSYALWPLPCIRSSGDASRHLAGVVVPFGPIHSVSGQTQLSMS